MFKNSMAAPRPSCQEIFERVQRRSVKKPGHVKNRARENYFPTKEALIRAVVGYAIQRFIDTMPGDGAAVDQLRAHLGGLARLLKEAV